MRYAVVIERAGANYSAYVPDLPGCIATGRTLPTVQRRIRQAVVMHIAGLREDGHRIPKPRTRAGYVSARPERRAG